MKHNYEIIPWDSFSPAPVIGVDEVGRGCLAGPVYAAAVVLQGNHLDSKLTDSKLLSEKRREELSALIKAEHKYAVAFATVEEIDELNILNASLLAMERAVKKLMFEEMLSRKSNYGHVVVDGKFKIPGLPQFQQTTIVKGDLRVAPISAASIVAKVTRDHIMKELGAQYPQYGFEIHKGYCTAFHQSKVKEWGPCKEHRKSFSGVKEYLARPLL